MKTSDKVKKFFQDLLKGALLGAVVAFVYCSLFMSVANQFGLTIEDYGIWMGFSAGVVVSMLNSLLKKKFW